MGLGIPILTSLPSGRRKRVSESSVGKTAREVFQNQRRKPVGRITIDRDPHGGPMFLRHWTDGEHPGKQLCIAEISLSDREVGELAYAMLGHVIWDWKPGDELGEQR